MEDEKAKQEPIGSVVSEKAEIILSSQKGNPPLSLYYSMKFQHMIQPVVLALAKLETWWLGSSLPERIVKPIFITGIARAGTTITLKVLYEHKDTSTQVFFDMLFPLFPIATKKLWKSLFSKTNFPIKERMHADGVPASPEEPEAFEEPLWMAYFPHSHDESCSNVLDEHTSNPAFESQFRSLMKKILYGDGKSRYVSKGNYNLLRTAYIRTIFPDAKIVLVVRHPLQHIASYVKSHHTIVRMQTDGNNPNFLEYIQWLGHFEFGLNVRFVTIDPELTKEFRREWDDPNVAMGRTPEGRVRRAALLGRYWSSLYTFAKQQADRDGRTLILRHEDLCADPSKMLKELFDYCELSEEGAQDALKKYLPRLQKPSYYKLSFSPEEFDAIRQHASAAASLFGYSDADWDRLQAECLGTTAALEG